MSYVPIEELGRSRKQRVKPVTGSMIFLHINTRNWIYKYFLLLRNPQYVVYSIPYRNICHAYGNNPTHFSSEIVLNPSVIKRVVLITFGTKNLFLFVQIRKEIAALCSATTKNISNFFV